jgi:sulfite reductase (ferredoxin)
MAEHKLDLRGVACPMNFVKTKLFLDKIPGEDVLTVLLDEGEPVESVCSSVAAEGHHVLNSTAMPGGFFSVSIRKDGVGGALDGTC